MADVLLKYREIKEISWENSTGAARVDGSFTILKSAKVKIQDTNAFQHEYENKSQTFLQLAY